MCNLNQKYFSSSNNGDKAHFVFPLHLYLCVNMCVIYGVKPRICKENWGRQVETGDCLGQLWQTKGVIWSEDSVTHSFIYPSEEN